ncbi:Peroxisomal membrane protein PAS20 [Sphaceloma murrayae]|uniref:Peroxisomal membrane protein PEX13 n=1 Tax=Sphaceloma murrayae TaxID=2082308 RepID=A0A2K1R0N7_9PEZI|nr:Peroxisomal membrane protein PAS20 [Sphaceloma murrayae]
MSGPSPPKPWERPGAGSTSAITSPTAASATSPTSATSSAAPALPSRPDTLNSVINQTASNYTSSPYNRMGSSPYGGGYGGMSSYSSPYSRLGGGYGGMGGMGGMYGGGYGGYGGMGGMYGGGYGGMGGGMYGMPGQEQSLTQSFSQSTQATFQIIESIVGAFGGFAQMLESTYMATHSSFFAMVSVAEQFGNLRNTLGSVLGIFAIIRWVRTAMAKLTGRPLPATSTDLTPANFHQFSGRAPDGSPAPPKASKKPFIIFLVTAFGLPYLMGKLIRSLAKSQEEEERRRIAANPQAYGQDGPLDPSKLDFCRVVYDFTPENNAQSVQGVDLAVKKGDLVAVLSKTDPLGNASEWWLCRARDGRKGYLPSPYLETIQRRPNQAMLTTASQAGSQAGSPAGSRVQTMTSTVADFAQQNQSRKEEMLDREKEKVRAASGKPEVKGKMGDVGVESFQKGMFNS